MCTICAEKMQVSSSISSSLESFDELNSISVARGFSSNAAVENEFGSFLGAELDDSLLSRLSVSLGKYYTVPHQTEAGTFESVTELMQHLKSRHCKINMKYSAQQVYEAALQVRDQHAIMAALSGCEEFHDGACLYSLWTSIVLAGFEKVMDKIKTVGKKKKARQEFVNEWNDK